MTKDVFMSMKLEQAVVESDELRPGRHGPARRRRLLLRRQLAADGVPGKAGGQLPVHRHGQRGRHGAHQPAHHQECQRSAAGLRSIAARAPGGAAHRRAGPGAEHRGGQELPRHQPGQGAAFRRGAQDDRRRRRRACRHRADGRDRLRFRLPGPSDHPNAGNQPQRSSGVCDLRPDRSLIACVPPDRRRHGSQGPRS
ncbi:MAG: hypothetical protein MZV70_20835 [Desulfobacterales bacterium]|nr:hypothetical protein [Desulfobacterales bacterium]